jgi:hypothetical protein
MITQSPSCVLCPFLFCMLHILQHIYLQDNGSYKYKLPLTPCIAGAPIIQCSGKLLPHKKNCRNCIGMFSHKPIAHCQHTCCQCNCLACLDRSLSKSGFVAEHQPCPAESLTHTAAESVNAHARCHCRCMLPFLPVVFTSSLGLLIVQTYRQPLLPILSTLPISPMLPNSPLCHCVIPTLFHQALDNPCPSPNSRQHIGALAVMCCSTHILPIFVTVTGAATP